MDEDRGANPQPPGDNVGEREPPQPPDLVSALEPAHPEDGDGRPDPEPVKDDITWLIYLAIGLVVFLALVVLSGMHSAMGH